MGASWGARLGDVLGRLEAKPLAPKNSGKLYKNNTPQVYTKTARFWYIPAAPIFFCMKKIIISFKKPAALLGRLGERLGASWGHVLGKFWADLKGHGPSWGFLGRLGVMSND